MEPRFVLRNVELTGMEVFGVPKIELRVAPHPPIFINVGDEHAGRVLLNALAELVMTIGANENEVDDDG